MSVFDDRGPGVSSPIRRLSAKELLGPYYNVPIDNLSTFAGSSSSPISSAEFKSIREACRKGSA